MIAQVATSASTESLNPDANEVNKFLRRIRWKGFLTLVGIKPDGELLGKSFDMPSERDKAVAWACKMNIEGMNVYFTVNPVKRPMNTKPSKTDIAQAVACWVDIDPDTSNGYAAGRDFLLNHTLPILRNESHPATIIIDSGNGLQALYILEEATDDLERVESVNRQLEAQFGSDHTHNIDRLLRVPGTSNHPTDAKLKKGYPEEPSMARLLVSNGPMYTLDNLEQSLPAPTTTAQFALFHIEFSEDQSPLTEAEESAAVDRLNTFLTHDQVLCRRWEGSTEGLNDASRSGMDMSFGSLLKMRGFSYREMRYLLTTWSHGAGTEKSNTGDERYFQRIWQRSTIKTPDEVIRALDIAITSGDDNAHDLLPLIADAKLGATDSDKCIQHLVKRGIGGKRALLQDLKQHIQENLEADFHENEDRILYVPHLLPEIVDSVCKLLSADEVPFIYLRGGYLCQLAIHLPSTVNGIVNKEKHLVIERLSITHMIDYLTRRFEFFRQQEKGPKPISCPPEVAQIFLSRSGKSQQPPLAAICHTPTLRTDGTVLSTPGYDRDTGLFLVDSSLCDLDIADKPTKKQALAALEALKEPFKEFPFDSEISRSVLIAAVFTAIIRPILRSAPMFLFDATKMGTGKSLLVNVITMIADGRTSPGMMSYTECDDEMRKRILSILMSGTNIVCIDNASIAIENDTLCTVLTEPVFEDRILGKNEQARVPTTTTWFATGNAIRVAGDLSTRTLQCRLDAQLENPEERKFERNLYEWVPEHREELVKAALTILRAYQVARTSWKDKITPWGRFEDWSRFVREPLVWLGMKDPYDSNAFIQAYDPVREELSAVLAAWHKVYCDKPMLLKHIVADTEHPDGRGPDWCEGLHDLKEILGHVIHRDLSSRSLGAYIKKYKGRIEDGYRVMEAGKKDKTTMWRVERMDS